MKSRRILARSGAITLAALLALTGCSSGGSSGSGADGEITLQMVESLTSNARTKVLQDMLDEFTKAHPKIKVKLISPPTEQADQKIQQMLQSGSGVDVLEVRDLTVGPFANNGWLVDMTKDIEGWDGFSKLSDKAQTYAKYIDDKIYFVPYGFYGLSLFYRTDLVKEAGFDGPPKTWDDLLDQASKIQDPAKNRYGYAFRGGKNGQTNVVTIIEAYVADKLDKENSLKTTDGKTIFASPEAQTAVDTYLKIFKEASPPSSANWGYPEMVEGFNNGSTAFLLQDPEVIAAIKNSKVVTADQWNTAPLLLGPTGKATQPVATAGWGVAKSSKHSAEAIKLVEFLSGPASTTFAKENSLVPIQADAVHDDYFKTGPWASYVTMANDPQIWLNVKQPRGVSWWTEWQQMADADLQQVLLGKLTSAEMLAKWDKFWTEKWAS